jgi:SAM-dependent methyltransferase
MKKPTLAVDDPYKEEAIKQWDQDPCGSHYTKEAMPHTLEWFKEVEEYRYGVYAPWMPKVMEFDQHSDEDVLEIGAGLGTDLSMFARHGARVIDLDLSGQHLTLAQENFRLRGLKGSFILHDAENLPFKNDSFDVVYTNGVLHHLPNTPKAVKDIHRVLRPGGRVIAMFYAEYSRQYWYNVYLYGLRQNLLNDFSIGEIMSRWVERSDNAAARPLVKVYTKSRLMDLFDEFTNVKILKRQLVALELPNWLQNQAMVSILGRLIGWNLIVKAIKRSASKNP